MSLVAIGSGEVRGDLEGDLLGVATAATWAAYSVAIAPLMRRYSPYRISAIVLVVGWIAVAATAAPQLARQEWDLGWEVWALLAFAVLGPLVLTNILWFKAVDRVGPSHATLFANAQPFVAVIFAVLLLGETLSWLQIVGGVGIGVGIWLARRKRDAPGARRRMIALSERLARKPEGYRFTIGRVLAIYAGLMTVLLLAALDQTIVATALPRIVSDIGGLTSYSWVITSYMLASTVTVPLYGKLGDVHGRRTLFMVSISIFLVGSALCGLAQNMTELVLFRAVQGLGAGGLFPLALATVGVIVPPRDRGRYQGLIGATFARPRSPARRSAASSSTTRAGAGFSTSTCRSARSHSSSSRSHAEADGEAPALDRLPRLLPARRRDDLAPARARVAGRQYAWSSPQVVGAFAAAAVLLALFGWVERHVREPILPFDLLRQRTVAAGVASMALVGMAMFGTIAFVPLFVQGVIGTSATSSGIVLTPLILGAVGMSILSGQWVSRTGHYRLNAIVGPIILGTGLFLLSRMDTSTTNGEAARNMVIAGIGLGLMMQVFVLVVQNSVSIRQMGSATALTQFSRQIGATLGVTLMGVIVNQGLPKGVGAEGTVVHRLPPALREALAYGAATGLPRCGHPVRRRPGDRALRDP